MAHTDLHPDAVAGCFACKLRTVQFAPSAMPTRNGGAQAAEVNARDKQLAKDSDAYKRLRNDGLQPMRRGGAAELEQRAECEEHVETGMVHVKPRSFGVFGEEFGIKVTDAQTTPLEPSE